MRLKWMASVLGALAIVGVSGLPARAEHNSPLRRNSNYSRPGLGNGRRGITSERAGEIARRARELHRDGRLSRDHLDRTLEKLERARADGWSGDRLSRDRFRADDRYLDQVENTLNEWSRADSRQNNHRPDRHRR